VSESASDDLAITNRHVVKVIDEVGIRSVPGANLHVCGEQGRISWEKDDSVLRCP
jgi:hypothetical protein